MSEELKPCPFCGGEAHIHEHYTFGGYVPKEYPNNEPLGYAIGCSKYDCRGKRENTGFLYDTEAQAIEAWNTRTPEQAIAATLGDDGYKQAAAYWKRMYEELLTERIGEEFDYPEHDGRYECPDCGNVVYYDELYGGGWTIYVEDYQIPFNHCPKCGKAVKR